MEFVWVSIDGRKPVPAELCVELGQRVLYTLVKPDQFFPDVDSRVKIVGPMEYRPRGLRPVGKGVPVDSRKKVVVKPSPKTALRGGLNCPDQLLPLK
jgi:hypothetical protein